MRAQVITIRDPFHPARGRESRVLGRARRVRSLAPKTQQPFIAILNGQPLLRAGWNRRLRNNDHLAFVALPLGGGDSNPLQMVLMIALIVAAPYAAAGLAGAMGVTSTVGIGLLQAGVMMAGQMLINAIVPPPRPPSPQQNAALAAPSPTYDLGAQGNYARLKSAIPVQYGRMRFPPDFAAQPYGEYAGNEQFLYQLFCLGQGAFDIEAITIEDTPIANFSEITYEVVPPGGTVTLYPANVITSVEVAGQEAITSTALGPFVANASGTVLNAIAIDVVASRGLFYAQDDGNLGSKTISWQVEARPIDSAGAPLAAFALLGSESLTGATNTPQRRSYRYSVSNGRYEVKLTRTDAKDTSSRAGHELNWVGLRGYLPGVQQYGNVTMLAMRMRASNNLSQAASRKVFVTATRKLKTWNPTTGWSATESATRSMVWALADAARNIDYGAELPDARLGLAELFALDGVLSARNDYFDGRFDNALTFWEALSQIAKTGRAKPYMQGGLLHLARDGTQTVPVALFNMRNIVRGSFSVNYAVTTSDTADAIDATYFDEQVWAQRPVRAALIGSAEQSVADVELFGITNRNHAWRESIYQLAATKYRSKSIKFTAEMEGFIPSFGDLIAISHDMPQWGQSAEAVSWNSGTNTLRLSEPVTFTTGTHYIGLARRDNSVDGPYVVTPGVDANTVVLATAPGFTPYTGDAEERTRIAFGPGVAWSQLALVSAIRPKGHTQVEIECVNYDDRVNTADATGVPPAAAVSTLPTTITVPAITGTLTVVAGGSVESPTLSASWQAASAAQTYLIEHSSDGTLWTHLNEVSTTSYAFSVAPGNHWLRVAPLGVARGAWLTWSGTVAGGAAVVPAPAPTAFSAVASENSIFLNWTNPAYGYTDRVEILRNTVNNAGGAQVIDSVTGPVGFYADYIGASGALRYYWLRVVNTKGVAGTLSGVASATTGVVTGVPPAGSVIHSMMAADAIWAGNIKAGEVQAGHMSANSITAGNGAIANLAVDTLQIANSAVTLPVSTSATNLVTYSTGGLVGTTQTVDVISATIVNPGIPILVMLTFQGQSANGSVTGFATADPLAGTASIKLEILRNGAVIILLGSESLGSGSPSQVIFPNGMSFIDSPGAGTFTYTVRATGSPAPSSFVFSYEYRFRSLTLLGLKK